MGGGMGGFRRALCGWLMVAAVVAGGGNVDGQEPPPLPREGAAGSATFVQPNVGRPIGAATPLASIGTGETPVPPGAEEEGFLVADSEVEQAAWLQQPAMAA